MCRTNDGSRRDPIYVCVCVDCARETVTESEATAADDKVTNQCMQTAHELTPFAVTDVRNIQRTAKGAVLNRYSMVAASYSPPITGFLSITAVAVLVVRGLRPREENERPRLRKSRSGNLWWAALHRSPLPPFSFFPPEAWILRRSFYSYRGEWAISTLGNLSPLFRHPCDKLRVLCRQDTSWGNPERSDKNDRLCWKH